jgi:uncharacterized lipoprotein YddW (UPF0748 family)
MHIYKAEKPLTYRLSDKIIEIPKFSISKHFRAFWVSNVLNIDLPNLTDLKHYEDKIIEMLDNAKRFNMTAIFFQVRTTSDAFYESKLNPTSRYLVAKEGDPLPYDILKWIIFETHKRNIEFHAWCNPYRVSVNGQLSKKDYLETCYSLNFAKRHQEEVLVDQKGILILNPASEIVKQHIVDSMLEIAKNYDIDGIHFDDYFYPYAGLSEEHDDKSQFDLERHLYKDIGDFRRAQVTNVIARIYHHLKQVNPKLVFGISPFGIWRNRSFDHFGSNTDPRCGQSYDDQFADTLDWIKKEIIDYIVPQVYWGFRHELAPFADIVDFWVDVTKNSKVKLYIGHGPYRLGNDPDYLDDEETLNQVKYASQYKAVDGHVFFTYHTFIDEGKTKKGVQLLIEDLTKEKKHDEKR